MLGKAYSVTLYGIEGHMVQVEANLTDGLPSFEMVGIPGSEVREARERVRTALNNSGFYLPPKRITLNLSPADIRKRGTGFDLPIAVAILAGMEYFNAQFWEQIAEDSIFCGELSLDGNLCATHGILSMVICAHNAGFKRCFVPHDNWKEAACVADIDVIAIHSISELFYIMQSEDRILSCKKPNLNWESVLQEGFASNMQTDFADFSEVNGQMPARRAVEIAAAGMHNLIMTGPPGSGKSMIARRIPSILPPLNYEESLEITRIHSVHGLLDDNMPLLVKRPFRAPHHTISASALAGGGLYPIPGEISLADRGVLFLDELPEFKRQTLEVLRQPMEDHKVQISRIHGCYEYPSQTMVVAAMNPCPCGYYPDTNRCNCTEWDIRRYRSTLSGPLMDRIDLAIEVLPIRKEDLYMEASHNESSEEIQKRVRKAHEIQRKRFSTENIFFNAHMTSSMVKRYCSLNQECKNYLEQKYMELGLSTRGYFKILKIARTIADLEGSKEIALHHLMEAICYRTDGI